MDNDRSWTFQTVLESHTSNITYINASNTANWDQNKPHNAVLANIQLNFLTFFFNANRQFPNPQKDCRITSPFLITYHMQRLGVLHTMPWDIYTITRASASINKYAPLCPVITSVCFHPLTFCSIHVLTPRPRPPPPPPPHLPAESPQGTSRATYAHLYANGIILHQTRARYVILRGARNRRDYKNAQVIHT